MRRHHFARAGNLGKRPGEIHLRKIICITANPFYFVGHALQQCFNRVPLGGHRQVRREAETIRDHQHAGNKTTSTTLPSNVAIGRKEGHYPNTHLIIF